MCGVRGTQTPWPYGCKPYFAYFYVVQCRLTSRLPAEIVVGCRWMSPGVWLRWLSVWLFWTVLLARRAGLVTLGVRNAQHRRMSWAGCSYGQQQK